MPVVLIPEEFICPITHELIKEPVSIEGDENGHLYERAALEEWFKLNNTVPLTSLPVISKTININFYAKRRIQDFLEKISKESDFFEAIESGDPQKIEKLNYLQGYFNCDKQGQKPLHLAVKNGHIRMIEWLLNYADIEVKNADDMTPLYLAVSCNLDNVAEVLIKNGANIEAKCQGNCTPLFLATKKGDAKMVECLLAKKAEAKVLNVTAFSKKEVVVELIQKNNNENALNTSQKYCQNDSCDVTKRSQRTSEDEKIIEARQKEIERLKKRLETFTLFSERANKNLPITVLPFETLSSPIQYIDVFSGIFGNNPNSILSKTIRQINNNSHDIDHPFSLEK